jgi:hypothetical protein
LNAPRTSSLGRLGIFAAALLLTSAAFFAAELGYTAVVCRGEGPLGWAALIFAFGFIEFPLLFVPYVLVLCVAAIQLRPAVARFGLARVLGAILAGLLALAGAAAALSAAFGLTARCSFGF